MIVEGVVLDAATLLAASERGKYSRIVECLKLKMKRQMI